MEAYASVNALAPIGFLIEAAVCFLLFYFLTEIIAKMTRRRLQNFKSFIWGRRRKMFSLYARAMLEFFAIVFAAI